MCYCLGQRRRRKRSCSFGQRENNKNVDELVSAADEKSESSKNWKKFGLDAPPKLTNKELQERRQNNIVLDVNQLSASKEIFKKLDTKELVAEKLTVPLEELKELHTVRDSVAHPDDANSSLVHDPVPPHSLSRPTSTSTIASQHHRRIDQSEAVNNRRASSKITPHRCGGHPGPPYSSSGFYNNSRRCRGYLSRRMQSNVHEYAEDDVDELPETSYSSSNHDGSRAPACCHMEPCGCDSHPPYSAYSKTMPEELSESEEVAMLMAPRSISPRCSHGHYRRCSCHRPTSQQRDLRRVRCHGQRQSSSFQEDDAYCSEADTRERLLGSPNRHLSRNSIEEPVLPPYESVVFTDSSYSHSTTPSCDCGSHNQTTSGHYLQSPPPCYSQHCSRTLQSRGSNEPRSGCERTPSYSGGPSSSRYDNAHICYAGRNSAALSGDNLARSETSVTLPCDNSTPELCNDNKSPTQSAVA